MNQRLLPRTLPVLLACAFSGTAFASGFQLLEQNASGLGNAYAGSAAVAEDASTIFYNPAGMTLLEGRQFSVGVNAIRPSAKFSNSASIMPTGITTVGGDGGDAGDWNMVPNAYLTVPVTDKIVLGLGIGAPFGLKTEYDAGWIGRFRATKSEIKTLNVNPSIAFKLNDTVSIGVGANYQKFNAELDNAVNLSGALLQAMAPGGLLNPFAGLAGAVGNIEGTAKMTGSDSAWGYNVGAMFTLSPQTRIGLSYRSVIKYTVTGDVVFTNPTVVATAPITPFAAATFNAAIAASTANGPVNLSIKMPDTFIASAYQRIDDRWEMMGDLSWTGWSKIQSLDVYRASGTLLSRTPENFRDTWRVAFGGTYRYSDLWKIKMGIAYDQTPVRDDARTPRLPDNNRTWLSVGAQYKPGKDSTIDFGYSYLYVPNTSSNNTGGSATSTAASGALVGSYKESVNILGVQYTQKF
jgi:long-chain fatty acid transport protein